MTIAALKTASFTITAEPDGAGAARDRLLDRAMAPNWRRKASEKLRRGRTPAIALVARLADGRLAGTVRLWPVDAGGCPALLLGPLAVDPAAQGLGLGAALMRSALSAAAAAGHGAVILMGDPDYYGRFGFSAKATAGLAMPGPFEPHRLMAVELRAGALDGAAGVIKAMGARGAVQVRRAA